MDSGYHPFPLLVSLRNDNERNGRLIDCFVGFEFSIRNNRIRDRVLLFEGSHFCGRIARTDSNDFDLLR